MPSSWVSVGSINVGPTSGLVTVGTLTIGNSDTSIYVRVVQTGGESPWPYGYGLCSWITAAGREMGTVKVWGHTEGEVYKLPCSLKPEYQSGSLVFEPRSLNLRWIQASGNIWHLTFQAQHLPS